MINVSEQAAQELAAFFSDKDKSPIRVFLAPGGCQGPRLALALDQPLEDDQVETVGDFEFVINKDLLASVGTVSLDASSMGFMLTPEIPLQGASGCGGCPSASSCG